MSRVNRPPNARILAAICALAIPALLPASASADPGHARVRSARGDLHDRGFHRGHNPHGRYAARYERGHRAVVARYRCRPCGHSFSSRSSFFGHLHAHHHVPPWMLPFAVTHHALGWVFYG